MKQGYAKSVVYNEDEPVKAKKSKDKLLIIAHNHPQFFPGGAEIIAYDLFNSLKKAEKYECFFLAGASPSDRQPHHDTPFQAMDGKSDEFLFCGDTIEFFYQSQKLPHQLYYHFKQLLEKIKPDIVHFHHTMRIGLEAIIVARQTLPESKIIYTLHEFLLICNRDGQMVRKHNNELCSEASPARCNQCFPEINSAKFKMREMFIKSNLEHVDVFISPSQFLADRFIQWGIPKEKMTVQENGRTLEKAVPFRKTSKSGKRNVFGYFGQINPYKGAVLTLKAVEYLVNKGFKDFRLELFGNVELQSDEFKKDFFEFLDKYSENVGFHGKYRNEDMPSLVQQVDWVIVPSTWWENSPLVIQEVFMHKRPILCSNIGGMAEKVTHGETGLHFKVRNEASLAQTMEEACGDAALWKKLVDNIGPRLSIEECAEKHVEIYSRLASQ